MHIIHSENLFVSSLFINKIFARPVLQETRAVPKETEAEIRVRAVGLNFRDVLNVMGLLEKDGCWNVYWVISYGCFQK